MRPFGWIAALAGLLLGPAAAQAGDGRARPAIETHECLSWKCGLAPGKRTASSPAHRRLFREAVESYLREAGRSDGLHGLPKPLSGKLLVLTEPPLDLPAAASGLLPISAEEGTRMAAAASLRFPFVRFQLMQTFSERGARPAIDLDVREGQFEPDAAGGAWTARSSGFISYYVKRGARGALILVKTTVAAR